MRSNQPYIEFAVYCFLSRKHTHNRRSILELTFDYLFTLPLCNKASRNNRILYVLADAKWGSNKDLFVQPTNGFAISF